MTSLSNVRLEQDLQALLQLGITPPHLLPGFVHETTHHWCFLSPVGFVLSMLQLRARRSGVLLDNGEGDAKELLHRLLGDVVRYETALAMLRPLAEGLAMFAEFDALSGPESSVVSVPAELVGWLFSGGLEAIKFGGIHLPEEGMRRPLIEWRRSRQCLQRKIAMLGHPFEVQGGGYLPGYLALRQLWFRVARQDHRLLNESDLFLMFARSFFYDDYELVGLLLDDAPVEFATSEAIILHIAGRFDALGRVTGEQIGRYERVIAGKGETQQELGWLADTVAADKERAEEGRRRASRLIESFEAAGGDDESVDSLLAMWDRRVLRQRDIINFGTLPVEVSVTEDGACHVTAGEVTLDIGDALPGTEPGTAAGFAHVFCSTLSGTKGRAVAIYRGDDRVALSFGGLEQTRKELQDQFMWLMPPNELQAGTEEMRDSMDRVLAWEGIAAMIAEMRGMLPGVSEEIYAAKAFSGIDPSLRGRAIAAMKKDGLLPLLRWDRKLVTGVALLSIAFSTRLRRPQIAELLAEHGLDLEDTLQDIAACSAEYGLPFVMAGDDVLLSSV